MKIKMADVLREDIFVMTRNKFKDYHWVYKPSYLKESMFLSKMEQVFSQLSRKNKIFISDWYSIKFNNNYEIIFRIVVDGRKDCEGRLIRRYEGATIKGMNSGVVPTLEKYLLEIQKETNNYGYGFEDSFQLEHRVLENEKELAEIELKDGKMIIKSNILLQFFQNHTYEDLLVNLQIEANNLQEKKL